MLDSKRRKIFIGSKLRHTEDNSLEPTIECIEIDESKKIATMKYLFKSLGTDKEFYLSQSIISNSGWVVIR